MKNQFAILSNPFHARAEYLRLKHLQNLFINFKKVEIGDVGFLIGSQPNRLFICVEETNEIKLFAIERTMLEDEEWDLIYGRKFVIIETITSNIGYHGLLLLEDKDLIINEEPQNETPNEEDIDIARAENEGMLNYSKN